MEDMDSSGAAQWQFCSGRGGDGEENSNDAIGDRATAVGPIIRHISALPIMSP
jgi:hypothetical protein